MFGCRTPKMGGGGGGGDTPSVQNDYSAWEDIMPEIRIRSELTFTNVPKVEGGIRRFIDYIFIGEGHSLMDFDRKVQEKLLILDCANWNFEILSGNPPTHVDSNLYDELIFEASKKLEELCQKEKRSSEGDGVYKTKSERQIEMSRRETLLRVTVELKGPPSKEQISHHQPAITAETLKAASDLRNSNNRNNLLPTTTTMTTIVTKSATGDLISKVVASYKITDFLMIEPSGGNGKSPVRGSWTMEADVKNISQSKNHASICEIEFYHAPDTANAISAVCFNQEVTNELIRTIHVGNHVSLQNAEIRVKSESDKKWQKNTHPFRIVLDQHSNVTVKSQATSRAHWQVAIEGGDGNSDIARPGVLSFGGGGGHSNSSGLRTLSTNLSSSSYSNPSDVKKTMFNASTASAGGLQQQNQPSMPTRTMFRPGSGPQGPMTSTILSNNNHTCTNTTSSLVNHQHVISRDRHLQMFSAREEMKDDQIRRKATTKSRVDPRCIFCGIDTDSKASIEEILYPRLKKAKEKLGRAIGSREDFLPSFEEVQNLMTDKSGKAEELLEEESEEGSKNASSPSVKKRRIWCETTPVHPTSKVSYRLHVRCAHIATSYQQGDSEKDTVAKGMLEHCYLCMELGALSQCYFPQCGVIYHTCCAIFSKGYVEFGKRDPFRPLPSCPAHAFEHTLHDTKGHLGKAKDGPILIDSSIVDGKDLRDPDVDGDDCW